MGSSRYALGSISVAFLLLIFTSSPRRTGKVRLSSAGSFPEQRLEIEPRNDEKLVIFDLFLFAQFQELLLYISLNVKQAIHFQSSTLRELIGKSLSLRLENSKRKVVYLQLLGVDKTWGSGHDLSCGLSYGVPYGLPVDKFF